MKAFPRILRDDIRGATAVEYGLIAALIVLAMLGALKTFANQSNATWTMVQQQSANAIAS